MYIKKISLYSIFSILGLFLAKPAAAICPICTVAIGAGVGLSRWIGIDDTITGIWIGALIISMSMWILNWLKNKKIDFIFRAELTYLAFFALVIVPLYYTGIMGHPLNTRWGVDKILLGIIFGAVVFLLAAASNSLLKKRNGGKSYFSYQKVVLPLSFLIIISLILYFFLI